METNEIKTHNPYEWATCILCDKEVALSFFELIENIEPEIRKKIFICDNCKYKITEDYIDYTDDFRDIYQTLIDVSNKFSTEELRRKIKDYK